MATTSYGVNHPLAVKLWSRKLFREALKQTYVSRFTGTTSGSVVQIMSDTQKGPGDRIRVPLRMLLSGAGVAGDDTLEGNEEALTTYYDDIVIDQLRHAVRSAGKMSEQRVPFSVREEARMGLQDWWSDRIDDAFFRQICGDTGSSDNRYTGSNDTVAPDSSHWIYGEGVDTSEASLTSASDKMSLSMIDYCVETAKTASPLIKPVRIMGGNYYVMFLHPYQVTSLRTNTDTGQWLDIQKSAMEGGRVSNNPIFTGALGMYNGVVLHESTRVRSVTSNVYRAVMCGAQSACIAYGQKSAGGRTDWNEELFDYGNQLGVEAGMIWGLKKTRFNSADFSTIVLSTWAKANND